MKYRKKPVVIEAMQWNPHDLEEAGQVAGWMLAHIPNGFRVVEGRGLQIDTLEDPMIASPGDWIIRGIKGEFYPCKPDIFEATYDRVED